MENLLSHITTPSDLRKLSENQLPQVAHELREFIIDIVSQKEGHLGASLGVIELTVALHYVFNTPTDLVVWDVGHQAYGHKILTERRTIFHKYREIDGISGFPKRSESIFDTFGVGHSSTSISAALGMAIASKINGETEKQHIAIIGDASIASGMAFEGSRIILSMLCTGSKWTLSNASGEEVGSCSTLTSTNGSITFCLETWSRTI